jgi:hypothetical protein
MGELLMRDLIEWHPSEAARCWERDRVARRYRSRCWRVMAQFHEDAAHRLVTVVDELARFHEEQGAYSSSSDLQPCRSVSRTAEHLAQALHKALDLQPSRSDSERDLKPEPDGIRARLT